MRYGHIIRPLIFGLFFTLSFLSFAKIKIYNSDLWWHLAQGRFIVETKALPEDDHFSYTASKKPSDRKSIILKGYWLSDTIFYLSYKAMGYAGIIFLRSILLLLFLFFIFLLLRLREAHPVVVIILLWILHSIALGFAGERPQLFTFLMFSVTLYILEAFRKGKSRGVYLIPLMVLLLSNMHPGFIILLLLLFIYLAGFIIEYLQKPNISRTELGVKRRLKTLAMVTGLSLIASVVNPNHIKEFFELFSMPQYTSNIVEFSSPVILYIKRISPVNYLYLVFIAIPLIGIRYIIRDPIMLLLFVVFFAMGLIAIRFQIFYMATGSLLIAFIIQQIGNVRFIEKFSLYLRKQEAFLYVALFVIGAFWFLKSTVSLSGYEFTVDTMVTPVGAAEFLSDNDIKGNIFNEYGFGGYLIWGLYPAKKVFIDGRALEGTVLNEYEKVIRADNSWSTIFDKYDITCVIMPPLLPSGNIYPIVERLLDENGWDLIYNDHLSLIFLKRDNRNESIRKRFLEKKEDGFNTIIFQASIGALKNRTNPYYLISLGKTFFRLGRLDEAKKAFMMAYQRDQKNPLIREWLQRL